MPMEFKLSICIQVFNRHDTLIELVESLDELPDVEILIADFSTKQEIREKNERYLSNYSYIKHLKATDGGLDYGFDYLVKHATGEFCWLLPDDDLVAPGAIQEILRVLQHEDVNFLILNTGILTKSRSVCLKEASFKLSNSHERVTESTFVSIAPSLSYVGSCIVRRHLWLEFSDTEYLSSYFMHVYIFSKILDSHKKIFALNKVAVEVRANNALWTDQAFQIWTKNWPDAIHSTKSIDNRFLTRVTRRPAHDVIKNIIYYFSYGALRRDNLDQFNFKKTNLVALKILLVLGRSLTAIALVSYLVWKYKGFRNEPTYYLMGRMKGRLSSSLYKYFYDELK